MTAFIIATYAMVAGMASIVVGALVLALADIARIGRAPIDVRCPWCDHDHRGHPCTIRIYLARHA